MSSIPILDVHERKPPPGWAEAVDDARAEVFHTLGWAGHRCHAREGDPLFCDWRDGSDGRIVARALAIRRPSRSTLAGRLVGRVVFDSTPVSDGRGLDFVSGVEQWARRQRAVVDVSLGSYDARRNWRPEGPPAPVARSEFLIEHHDPDAVTQGVGGSVRRNLRKAERAGVEVRRAGLGDLRLFAELYDDTLQGLRERKNVESPHLARQRFAASLVPLLESGDGRLYLAYRNDGSPEAGWVFAVASGGASAVYSGAAPSARETGSGSLALVEAIRDLISDGYQRVNLGGTPASASDPESPEHGLYNFKLRFGARVEPCTSGSVALRRLPAAGFKRLRALARR